MKEFPYKTKTFAVKYKGQAGWQIYDGGISDEKLKKDFISNPDVEKVEMICHGDWNIYQKLTNDFRTFHHLHHIIMYDGWTLDFENGCWRAPDEMPTEFSSKPQQANELKILWKIDEQECKDNKADPVCNDVIVIALTITAGPERIADIAWETKHLFSSMDSFLKNIKDGKDAKAYFEYYSHEELFIWQKNNGKLRFAIRRDNEKDFETLIDIFIDKELFIKAWNSVLSDAYSFMKAHDSHNWIQK
ncbi:hypothetical protein Emin_0240 [Elusimicrobium minutum Pei191]|uniref:Uncharacterized protein n=1 Tax=Elusimicrobium minutum (strain Pei191) TaxID=445932 RepID=B2KB43_ELUMP|nr:hypothetical protein [Elusimicrobium minutum]ACC97802.1 hypothetical protein Emin_0240 [Elusimicrobium minutum Pei191]